jgi:hypothetical protein
MPSVRIRAWACFFTSYPGKEVGNASRNSFQISWNGSDLWQKSVILPALLAHLPLPFFKGSCFASSKAEEQQCADEYYGNEATDYSSSDTCYVCLAIIGKSKPITLSNTLVSTLIWRNDSSFSPRRRSRLGGLRLLWLIL